MQERKKIFISYSHKDAKWLQRLRTHLKPLERDYPIEVWDDTRISPGARWREEIEEALSSAKLAILLVSADFLASDFIAEEELPRLLRAAERDGATILPVILSPSRFASSPALSQFQSVNDPKKPLAGMSKSEQDAVLVKVTEAIESSPKMNLERRVGESSISGGSLRDADNVRLKDERYNPKSKRISWTKVSLVVAGVLVAALIVRAILKPYAVPPSPSMEARKSTQYAGRVTDASTNKAVAGAKVSVDVQGIPRVVHTDSEGVFNLTLDSSVGAIHVRVEADGYDTINRNVPLPQATIEDIRLKRLVDVRQPTRPGSRNRRGNKNAQDEIDRTLETESPTNRNSR